MTRHGAGPAVPGDVPRVEKFGLEATYQGVLENVATLLPVDLSPDAHEARQAANRPGRTGFIQNIDHRAPVAVVGGTAARGIDAADACYHCEGLHCRGIPGGGATRIDRLAV